MQNLVKETVTQQTPTGVATVATQTATDTGTQTIANVIYFIAGIMEITLIFRFILKITGANPSSSFVAGIYGFTQLLVLPFRGIFSATAAPGLEVKAVFEPATLVAIAVYAVIAWGLVRLAAIMSGHSGEEL